MRSHRLTFAASIVASAAVHAGLLWELPRWANAGRPATPVPRQVTTTTVPQVALPPPPARPAIGKSDGTGDANAASLTDGEQTAKSALLDQAALTRDPTSPRPGPAAAPQSLAAAVTAPPPAALPTPPPTEAMAFRKPTPPKPPQPPSPEKPPDQKPPDPRPPSPAAPKLTPSSPAGGKPVPHSDRDSDLFAKKASVEYRAGRVVARHGREVKFARPRQDLAAMLDAAMLAPPVRLTLSILVDPDGHARSVRVSQSSGSASLDRAFELAAYESWFEPAKDGEGRPIRDLLDYAIEIR